MPDDPRPGSWQERARDLPFRGPLNRDEEEQLSLRPVRHEADVRPLHPEVAHPEEPDDRDVRDAGPEPSSPGGGSEPPSAGGSSTSWRRGSRSSAGRRCAWAARTPRRACRSRT